MFLKYTDVRDLIADLTTGVSIGYDRGVIRQVAINSGDIETSKNPITIFVKNPDTYFDNTLKYTYKEIEFKQITFAKYILGLNYYLQIVGNTIESWGLLSDIEKNEWEINANKVNVKFSWDREWNLIQNNASAMEITLNGQMLNGGDTIRFDKDVVNPITSLTKTIRITNKGVDPLRFTSPTQPLLLTDSLGVFEILNQPTLPLLTNEFIDIPIQIDYTIDGGGEGSILILTNDPNNEQFVINLEGETLGGYLDQPFKVDNSFKFITEIGFTDVQFLSFKNSGEGSFVIDLISFFGDNPTLFTHNYTDPYPIVIPPGEVFQLMVTYTPDAFGIIHSANLQIDSEAGGVTVSLFGIAVDTP